MRLYDMSAADERLLADAADLDDLMNRTCACWITTTYSGCGSVQRPVYRAQQQFCIVFVCVPGVLANRVPKPSVCCMYA
jgi:hypothetical protein